MWHFLKMGWFDESDNSEDEKPKYASHLNAGSVGEQAVEDEDPLDAYMKSLETTTPKQVNSNAQQRVDEFTPENEPGDWERDEDIRVISDRTRNTIHHDDSETEEEDNDEHVLSQKERKAREAREALNSTFVKAGFRKSDVNQEDPMNRASKVSIHISKMSTDQTSTDVSFEKSFWAGCYNAIEATKWRDLHSIKCGRLKLNHGESTDMIDPIYEFVELRDVLGNDLLQKLLKDYSKPTLVQSQTLPLALSGGDAIITAATGQGKTLAYLLPIAVHLAHQSPLQLELGETGPIALVLVPTRELAIQVEQQAKSVLAAAISEEEKLESGKLSCRTVIGGQGKYLLRQDLKKMGGVDLVVATPGRLLDVLSDRKGLNLNRVSFVVLDEADKMLQMGFEADVRKILSNIRKDRQTLMLSATMGHRVEKVASEWLSSSAFRLAIGRTGESSDNVNQHVLVLPNEDAKESFLLEILPTLVQVGRTIVFVATRLQCENIASILRSKLPPNNGVNLQTLHGDKHQNDRNVAVRAFKKGDVNVLIATDVAGRGLDIPNIQNVVSFDPAKNLDTHVHRVGRAGRLSKESSSPMIGTAYTLLTPKNADFALVLRNAFEREGRHITPELESLVQKSRRNGNVESRTKRNKLGLGLSSLDASINVSSTRNDSNGASASNIQPHSLLPSKRPRWDS